MKACKGCVCNSCKISPKSGDVYGCPKKRCKQCEGQEVNIKLSYCEEHIPQEEGGETLRL